MGDNLGQKFQGQFVVPIKPWMSAWSLFAMGKRNVAPVLALILSKWPPWEQDSPIVQCYINMLQVADSFDVYPKNQGQCSGPDGETS